MEIILISGFVYLFIYFRIFCVLARFWVYEFRWPQCQWRMNLYMENYFHSIHTFAIGCAIILSWLRCILSSFFNFTESENKLEINYVYDLNEWSMWWWKKGLLFAFEKTLCVDQWCPQKMCAENESVDYSAGCSRPHWHPATSSDCMAAWILT